MARQGYYIPKLRRRLLPEEAAALQAVPSPVFAAMTAAAKDNNIYLCLQSLAAWETPCL